MEILSVKTVTNTITEVIETKCGNKYILVQMYSNDGSEMIYTIYDLNGVDVTDELEVNQMMGHYFELKYELENGINSDDDDVLDIDPFK
jgi:hypothetical protein